MKHFLKYLILLALILFQYLAFKIEYFLHQISDVNHVPVFCTVLSSKFSAVRHPVV